MTAVTPTDALRLDQNGGHSTPSRGWVQSPLWDGFWMFSALWGSLLLLVLVNGIGWKRATIILFVGNGLLALFHS